MGDKVKGTGLGLPIVKIPFTFCVDISLYQGRLMWIYSLGDIKEAPIHNEGSLFLLLVFIVFFVETYSIV